MEYCTNKLHFALHTDGLKEVISEDESNNFRNQFGAVFIP